jgi:hypothetical protein
VIIFTGFIIRAQGWKFKIFFDPGIILNDTHTMNYPDHIHFSSYLTGISLELPIGFEEQEEDEVSFSVIYADDLDEDDMGARVLAKLTPVPRSAGDAFSRMADESAKLPGRESRLRESLTLDGLPAVRQVLEYRDKSLGLKVVRHETYAQDGEAVFSLIALAPADKEEEYLPEFARTSEGLRFIHAAGLREGASFTHPGLQLSVLLPHGWGSSEEGDHQIRFYGPVCSDHDDYRPTLSFTLGEPEGHGEEWFDRFCRDRLGRLEQSYSGFSLISAERLSLSSLAEMDILRYTFEPEPGWPVSQLQALIYADRYRMYLINASTLLPLQDLHMPVFDAIAGSLRILPPL